MSSAFTLWVWYPEGNSICIVASSSCDDAWVQMCFYVTKDQHMTRVVHRKVLTVKIRPKLFSQAPHLVDCASQIGSNKIAADTANLGAVLPQLCNICIRCNHRKYSFQIQHALHNRHNHTISTNAWWIHTGASNKI